MSRKVLLAELRGTSPSERVILLVMLFLALIAGGSLSVYDPMYALLGISVTVIALLCLLRQYKALILLILIVRILLDYYHIITLPLWIPFISVILAAAFLAYLFLLQSQERPWVRTGQWPYWALLLGLSGLSLAQSVDKADGLSYYLNIILSGFIFWALGIQLSRNATDLRRLLGMITGLGAAIGIHAIITELTGVFILSTPAYDSYVVTTDGLRLWGTNAVRVGSFLLNPDTAGGFFAFVGLLALGLALGSATWPTRVLYLVEAALILLALLFTFSTSSFVALAAGGLVFVVFMTKGSQRIYPLIALALALGVAFLAFRSATIALIQHAQNPGEYSLRLGIWLTALRMISASPLIGVGLGTTTYLTKSVPFQTSLQTRPEAHPHDSYLEYAVMSGIPALILFLIILFLSVRPIIFAARSVSGPTRGPLIGALAAIMAVSVNSLPANTWTVQPNVAIIWLVIGAAGSPALLSSLQKSLAATQMGLAHSQHALPAPLPGEVASGAAS